ncbi:hypothetical protein M408DRAFT_232057 [Serendipita vermifera MAFF 305830]|uniref:Secreted protein n=1 Tax=Serendipita vermifera MAFF 305830 TaxID=933852 RepID=A0A0C2X570_SERVB|nr:hypothetical protein M408DRAFT_232057 [Serendipita vermifera MAFF 305830]
MCTLISNFFCMIVVFSLLCSAALKVCHRPAALHCWMISAETRNIFIPLNMSNPALTVPIWKATAQIIKN